MATRLKPKLLALVLGGAMLLAALVNCAARNDGPTSLFRAAAARDLSQEERWRLDTELMDEAGMKIHNNRRFDVPEPFEKRARWVESVAHWYRPADLFQQLVDFRKSVMHDNEPAFRQLVELGLAGDISAKCLAAGLYRHHERAVTDSWKYSFAFVANEAMKVRESGHPVCAAVEASLYLTGDAGFPRDRARAKSGLVQSALAGMYGSQLFLSGMHLDGALRQVPEDVSLNLCWQRVADAEAGVASFGTTCEAYRMGIASDRDGKPVPLRPEVQRLAAQWCEPNRSVTAQTCADLERQLAPEMISRALVFRAAPHGRSLTPSTAPGATGLTYEQVDGHGLRLKKAFEQRTRNRKVAEISFGIDSGAETDVVGASRGGSGSCRWGRTS